MESLNLRINEATDLVIKGFSNDRDFDQYIKGLVKGLTEVVEWEPDFQEETNEIQRELFSGEGDS